MSWVKKSANEPKGFKVSGSERKDKHTQYCSFEYCTANVKKRHATKMSHRLTNNRSTIRVTLTVPPMRPPAIARNNWKERHRDHRCSGRQKYSAYYVLVITNWVRERISKTIFFGSPGTNKQHNIITNTQMWSFCTVELDPSAPVQWSAPRGMHDDTFETFKYHSMHVSFSVDVQSKPHCPDFNQVTIPKSPWNIFQLRQSSDDVNHARAAENRPTKMWLYRNPLPTWKFNQTRFYIAFYSFMTLRLSFVGSMWEPWIFE